MTLRWLIATLHLLALAIGFGALVSRARTLRGELDAAALQRLFTADTFWGLAGFLWIGTGLWRAFGGLEKGSAYYLNSHFFLLKMFLLGVVLALEIAPMIGLIRWRIASGRKQALDLSRARLYSAISFSQVALLLCMLMLATALARFMG
jgi:putative membrane protein